MLNASEYLKRVRSQEDKLTEEQLREVDSRLSNLLCNTPLDELLKGHVSISLRRKATPKLISELEKLGFTNIVSKTQTDDNLTQGLIEFDIPGLAEEESWDSDKNTL